MPPLDATTKRCTACSVDKPRSEFYANKTNGADGLTARCKVCHNVQSRTWVQKNPERRREIERRHNRRYRDKYQEAGRVRYARLRYATPKTKQQAAAQARVAYAVKQGSLIPASACEQCGAEERLDAHHPRGYEQPLDVVWLCRPCHRTLHNAEKRAARAS